MPLACEGRCVGAGTMLSVIAARLGGHALRRRVAPTALLLPVARFAALGFGGAGNALDPHLADAY